MFVCFSLILITCIRQSNRTVMNFICQVWRQFGQIKTPRRDVIYIFGREKCSFVKQSRFRAVINLLCQVSRRYYHSLPVGRSVGRWVARSLGEKRWLP